MIQAALLERSRGVLAAAGIPAEAVTMDGRDATLRGVMGSAAVSPSTLQLVEAVNGVRVSHTEVIPAANQIQSSAPIAGTVAVQKAQVNLDQELAAGVVEFNTASAELTPRGRAVLDRIAPILAAVPGAQCEIAGHTDTQGVETENRKLSESRALATKAYLVGKGLDGGRLFPVGFGSTKPIATNATAEGRQKNRRIEFKLKGNQ